LCKKMSEYLKSGIRTTKRTPPLPLGSMFIDRYKPSAAG